MNLLKDSEPIISTDNEEDLVFKLNKKKIKIKDFRASESDSIKQALLDIKGSTCKTDKIALIPIMEILEDVLEEESINDTKRV